ncbi:hypothetical protein SAMN05421837_103628 [Amycolatopsis pretoriensis]|uniref:DUF6542 domain-containing protein n=1 Tax=Amycolatopsis pretoriensis TaxID=218821 RepID=A0A1H5QP02_9PSEU|nr:DUF6542 domain-containing protein [Amycolatopsis pretoriensis]SEF27088.1 hypothetical protein SAMN05421837_103628 [Amycolatopsis pretoriensis]
MTAIRDRQSDPDADDVSVPWDERPVAGSRRGLPWWAAVLVGFGLAIVGAVVGKPTQNSIPVIFTVLYIAGAVIAVCAVRRRGIFGPMVMPPLVLAVSVPAVILLTSGSEGDDMLSKALSIGTPLINSFPIMAITTGITLLIGFVRIFRERDPDAPKKAPKGKAADRRRADEDDEKPSTRAAATSAGGRPRPPGSSRTGQTPVPPRRGRDGEPQRRPRPPADGERRTPADGERRTSRGGAPAERDRGARKPPPSGRRTPPPADSDPRRRSGDAPRRRPRPPAEDGRDTPPRRPSGGRGAPPRRNRPWDDEER